MDTMLPSRTPMSPRAVLSAVTIVPPRITRSSGMASSLPQSQGLILEDRTCRGEACLVLRVLLDRNITSWLCWVDVGSVRGARRTQPAADPGSAAGGRPAGRRAGRRAVGQPAGGLEAPPSPDG